MRQKIIAVVLLVVLFAIGFSGQLIPQSQVESAPNLAVTDVFINEVDSDTVSTDTLEFVELYDGGTGNTALDGLVVVFYNGSVDTSYAAFDLDGFSTDGNGYFVLGNTAVSGVDITFADNFLQNGADAVALYMDDATTFPNGTAITTTNLQDAIAYDTADADDPEILTLLNGGQPQVDEAGGGDKDNHSNQRCLNGAGGQRNTDTYLQAAPSPDASNTCPTIIVNELDSDTAGTDALEFVELYDGGVGNIALDGLVVVFFNGSSDTSYAAYDLDGFSTDGNGYLILGNAGITGADIVFADNFLQNGADAVALYVDNATTFPNGTAVTTTNLQDAIVYDTNDADDPGLLVLLNGGQPQVNEGSGVSADDSNQRCPNGTGGLRNTNTYVQAAPSSDADNNCAPPVVAPIINEFVFDHTGVDSDEFIEIYGTASTDYSAYSLLVVEGDGADAGIVDAVFAVGSTNASGYWATAFQSTLEGNTQTILLVEGSTAVVSNDIDTNNDGVIDNVLWTTIVDAVAVEDGDGGDLTYGVELSPTFDGGATNVGGASRIPNATDTDAVGDWTRNDFQGAGLPSFPAVVADPGEAINTPNAVNAVQPTLELIHNIQGNGTSVTNPGTTVTVQGIVVGDYQEDDELDGFFIQEETTDQDGNVDTSEGIFVYCGNNCLLTYADVTEGDLVTVTGLQEENFNMSQLDVPAAGGSIVIDTPAAGIGLVTPASIDLPVPGGFATVDLYYEQFEGMLVTFVDTMTVTEHFELFRYGQFVLSEGGKLDQYTQIGSLPLNATDYNNHLDAVARRSIILDDLSNFQNSLDPVYHPQPNGFSVSTYVRAGATIPSLTGVLHWSWAGQSGTDAWRIRPQITNSVTFNNPSRPGTPVPGGNITVASFNVLNYFNGDGLGGGFPTSRGADSAAEFTRQTDKIVAAIVAMDADVIGLMEIENDADNGNSAVEDLVDALNTVAGAGTYDFVASGVDGTDEIKVALIYKPAVVSPIGAHQVLDTNAFVDPLTTGTPKNRPALAQTFQVTDAGNPDNGEAFTVVVLHLKSKGSGCGAGDDDTTTGQGNCNGTRTAAAAELTDWLLTDPTDTATNLGAVDTDFLIIGDFNAYYQEDPMQEFYNDSYTNALTSSDYSYVFSGQWGSLDHGVSSSSLTSQVAGAEAWHINSDENALLDYNDTILDSGEASYEQKPNSNGGLYNADQYRASDHDAIVIGLDLTTATPPAPDNDLVTNAEVFTGNTTQDIAWATVSGSDPSIWCTTNYVNSVWFTYTPATPQYFTFTATSASASLNPVLGIFSGTEGALNTLGCDTDTTAATTSVNLSGGQTYTIMVAHNDTTQITSLAEFTLSLGLADKNDAVVLFDPATSDTGILDSALNGPNEFAYTNTPPSAASAEWVMGDWNGDGVRTPGIFDSGVFRYTNDLGPSTNWSSGMWLGNASSRVKVISGRYDSGFANDSGNDCIGWMDSNTSPVTGDLRFSFKWWCDMTATGAVALTPQWLGAPLGDSQGFSGTHQWVYGDWDSDGFAEPGVRRAGRIARGDAAPFEGAAFFGSGAQRWDTLDGDGPGAHGLDDGEFVAGDWNNDGQDTWGVVYDDGEFYYRDDISVFNGNFEFQLQTFTSSVSTPRQVDSHHAASGGTSTPAPAGPVVFRDGEDAASTTGGTVDTSRNVEANLSVSKAGNYNIGQVGLVGDSIVWTITLSNTGSAPANGVEITDNVPAELRVDDAYADTGVITVRGQAVTFTVDSIGVGETVQFQVVTTILQQPTSGTFANSVNVLLPEGGSGGSDANLVASGTVTSVDGLPATGYTPKFRW